MKKSLKKVVTVLTAFALCFCLFQINRIDAEAAADTIKGNYTKATAYHYGRWSAINSNPVSIILEEEKEESWAKFTLAPGDHIYIRAPYNKEFTGEWFEIQDGLGNVQGEPQRTPDNVYNKDSAAPSVYLNCDNNSTSTRDYYFILHRNGVNKSKKIYYSLKAYNRIRESSVEVSVSGTATNPGNRNISAVGVDSTVLSVDLTKHSKLPEDAIVKNIFTSGTQSPSQALTRHMIMPETKGAWYTTKIPNADRGSYNIGIDDGLPVKQLWSFKYNTHATAKSTMRYVKLTIDFQYDLKNTDYELLVRGNL